MGKYDIPVERTVIEDVPTRDVFLDETKVRNNSYTEIGVVSAGVVAVEAVNGGIWLYDELRSIDKSPWEVIAQFGDSGMIFERQE